MKRKLIDKAVKFKRCDASWPKNGRKPKETRNLATRLFQHRYHLKPATADMLAECFRGIR